MTGVMLWPDDVELDPSASLEEPRLPCELPGVEDEMPPNETLDGGADDGDYGGWGGSSGRAGEPGREGVGGDARLALRVHLERRARDAAALQALVRSEGNVVGNLREEYC